MVGLQEGERGVRAQIVVADPREPLHRHEAKLEAGRAPMRPDEVLISPSLADRISAGIGSQVHPADGPPLTVTGIAEAPFSISCEQIVALPRLGAARLVEDEAPINLWTDGAEYLVDLPARRLRRGSVARARRARGRAHARDAYLHPDRYDDGMSGALQNLRDIAMAMLISGLGLLEVVLLAGAAFAVGARRQTRELGLVGASGGSARHVRRIVLAQGLVLGALGAVLGVAFGTLVAVAGRPLWEHLENGRIVSWGFGPYEIAGAALIGLLSGLAAAVIPAVGAEQMRPWTRWPSASGRAARRASARRRPAFCWWPPGCCSRWPATWLLADDFAAYARELEAAAGNGTGHRRRRGPAVPWRWSSAERCCSSRRARGARAGRDRRPGHPGRADAALHAARDARRGAPPAPHRPCDQRDRRRRGGLGGARVPVRGQPARRGAALRPVAAAARAGGEQRRDRRARAGERHEAGFRRVAGLNRAASSAESR